jgi:hypothetical protein
MLFLLIPVAVFAGIPNIENCSIATRATENVSVMISPGCSGDPFSAAQTFGGGVMDATIEVYIRDIYGQGVADVPAEDIFIEAAGLCWCTNGNIADFNTLSDGYTEFALPACGGGCHENFVLSGFLLTEAFIQNPLPYISFNSPDFNCDLIVDLVDLSTFAAAYFADPPAPYCVDLYWDGVMNLQDLARFSAQYGLECAP